MVDFDELKNVLYYVEKSLQKVGDEFEITFHRKSVKFDSFIYPLQKHISFVYENNIKLILLKYLIETSI